MTARTLVASTVPRLRFYATAFVVMGVPFGITIGFLPPASLLKGLFAGAFFGTGMTWFIALMQARLSTYRHPGGVPAVRQTASLLFRGALPEARQAAATALQTSCGRVVRNGTDTGTGMVLRVRTRTSWKSWGKVITVSLAGVGLDQVRVTISSRPWFPLTIADYGKGFDNVARVVAALESSGETST
jgi:hypothetical protein